MRFGIRTCPPHSAYCPFLGGLRVEPCSACSPFRYHHSTLPLGMSTTHRNPTQTTLIPSGPAGSPIDLTPLANRTALCSPGRRTTGEEQAQNPRDTRCSVHRSGEVGWGGAANCKRQKRKGGKSCLPMMPDWSTNFP